MWLGTFGMATPLAKSAVHDAGPAPVSHHCVLAQLVSDKHESAQAPVAWQMPPACVAPAAMQATLSPAVPHVVHAPPPPGQYGVATSQVADVPAPLSPLQAAQTDVPLSQSGVAPPQLLRLVEVHSRHKPVPPPAEGSQTWLRHVPLVPDASTVVHAPKPFA